MLQIPEPPSTASYPNLPSDLAAIIITRQFILLPLLHWKRFLPPRGESTTAIHRLPFLSHMLASANRAGHIHIVSQIYRSPESKVVAHWLTAWWLCQRSQ